MQNKLQKTLEDGTAIEVEITEAGIFIRATYIGPRGNKVLIGYQDIKYPELTGNLPEITDGKNTQTETKTP
jgi:hypothetical protein